MTACILPITSPEMLYILREIQHMVKAYSPISNANIANESVFLDYQFNNATLNQGSYSTLAKPALWHF